MIPVPQVLPSPNDARSLEASDVLVIRKDANSKGDAPSFMTVFWLSDCPDWDGIGGRQFKELTLVTSIAAPYDVVLSYAVEFARMNNIDVVYDGISAQ